MSSDFRNNHYVPEWYQKRFIPPGQKAQELYYLDLNPGVFTDGRGVSHPKRPVRRIGCRHCFTEKDLYTTTFAGIQSTRIESAFFGKIDDRGRHAVDYFANFSHPWDGRNPLQDMMMYMSTQKLRTPKALDLLRVGTGHTNKNLLLGRMLQLQQIHCAIWTECVWLIADASQSATKFIISDHPVTVYNRRCGPRSHWCSANNDPDIRLNATHTIFPLSLDKVLILTNLSWVRNPYGSEMELRPNPRPLRTALFKITDIQTLRHLSEQEVQEINFIIKSRARRYIAAGKEEWLYPEKVVSKSNWNRFGHGYLLMPDPRSVTFSGEVIMGFNDGSATAFDEYGYRPWQPAFGGKERDRDADWLTFNRFQGEFARLFGPYRRGRAFNTMTLDREKDDEEYHQYHISLEQKMKRAARNRRKRERKK